MPVNQGFFEIINHFLDKILKNNAFLWDFYVGSMSIALAYALPGRRLKVDDNLPDQNWFLAYIRCRDLGDNVTKSILEIISSITHRAEILKYEQSFQALVEDALQEGRMLFLLDGLDEVSQEKNRICLVNQLRTFVATYPNTRLVVTSREAGFRAVASTLASYCRQYTIDGMDKDEIRLLSLKWMKRSRSWHLLPMR